jgi:anti-sigma regulatory factor (Ser/Thr protein kinase)
VEPNECYLPPDDLLVTTADLPDPVDAPEPTRRITGLSDLADVGEVRAALSDALGSLEVDRGRCRDFVTAVSEVTANGLRHGRPPVEVALWATATRLACTVSDHGDGWDDPLAGFRPPDDTGRGVGLWLARQTCDALSARRTPTGFTVRLTTELPRLPGGHDLAARAAVANAAAVRAARARRRAEELVRRFDEREDLMVELTLRGLGATARLPRLREDLERRRGH